MLCVLPQHEIPRSFPGLKLPKLCFLFCRCLLMDLPDSSRTFRSPPLKGEKKTRNHGKKMTFGVRLILYIISIIHNYKLKSHHSAKLRPR